MIFCKFQSKNCKCGVFTKNCKQTAKANLKCDDFTKLIAKALKTCKKSFKMQNYQNLDHSRVRVIGELQQSGKIYQELINWGEEIIWGLIKKYIGFKYQAVKSPIQSKFLHKSIRK